MAVGECAGTIEDVSSQSGRRLEAELGVQRQEFLGPGAALGPVAAREPKPPGGFGQLQGGRRLLARARPTQGGADIIVIEIQPIEPEGAVGANPHGLGLLGEAHDPC